MDFSLFSFLTVFLLASIQSIIGVGVLVVGTPLLLLLKYDLIFAISFLLPISIMTSLINLIIDFTLKRKISNDINLKYFCIFALPSVFVGLLFLNYLNTKINFNILVSLIILLSIILKNILREVIQSLSNNFKKILLIIIGLLHGLTNSGGTLLSILLIFINSNKYIIRNQLTFFYFLLATIQFVFFAILFREKIIELNQIYLFSIPLCFGVLLGNILLDKINYYFYTKLVYGLASIAALFLILKVFIF